MLDELAASSAEGLHAVIPARLGRTKGRAPHFRLRITQETEKGWKGVARLGTGAQEVFFVGSVPREELQRRVDAVIARLGVGRRG